MKDVTKDLTPITTKYNGELKARIKDINELNKKLNHKIKPKKAEHISDYLGTRISTDTIMQAKMVLSDLNKVVKFIHIDDFLSDGGRAAIFNMQDGYDAARLLLDSLWVKLAPEFKGNFYVAAPARDMFMAISCGPDSFVEKLQDRIELDYKRMPYPISSDLFLVTQDGVAGTRAA